MTIYNIDTSGMRVSRGATGAYRPEMCIRDRIEELREKYGDNSEIGTLEDSTAANVVIGLHRDAEKGGEILNPIEISH